MFILFLIWRAPKFDSLSVCGNLFVWFVEENVELVRRPGGYRTVVT